MITLKESIVAGILIGMGVIINTLTKTPELGALFFSFGLLTIIELGIPLYTGRVGFYDLSKEKTKNLIVILFGNLFGILMCIFLYNFANPNFFNLLTEKALIKFEKGFLECGMAAVFCGALIHFAVKVKQHIVTVLAIMLFILMGAEHCIADFPYVLVTTDPMNLLKFLVIIIGNSLGAIFIENMLKKEGI